MNRLTFIAREFNVLALICGLMLLASCEEHHSEYNTEAMMKRADSIDSVAAIQRRIQSAADSEHNADSAQAAYEWQKFHDVLDKTSE